MRKLFLIILFIVIVAVGGYFLSQKQSTVSYKTPQESLAHVRFGMEAYDLIQENYWAENTQYDLPNLFKLAIEKVSNKTFALSTSTRSGVAEMLYEAINLATSTEAKKDLTLNTLTVVLYNLQPVGRNGILSTQEETALRQNVSNINPETDLYKDLGIAKGAKLEEIEKAFAKKDEELKKATTTESKAEREKIAYAKKVLTNTESKTLYDENQIEPTIFSRKLGKTLYLYVSKISPTTFIEFARAVDNASTTVGLDSMILDMRGNVGGSLDFAQHFLGLFLGQNQYAFDLFHQGNYGVQRTVQPRFPELARYGDIAVITDNMTQSTAEVISATFKRLNLGKIIGATTRGWGTVENTYPVNTVIDPTMKYTLLLVNSITLRDDNQPIEGRGVDPDIFLSDSNWKSKLNTNFRSSSLIDALGRYANQSPLK